MRDTDVQVHVVVIIEKDSKRNVGRRQNTYKLKQV